MASSHGHGLYQICPKWSTVIGKTQRDIGLLRILREAIRVYAWRDVSRKASLPDERNDWNDWNDYAL